MLFERLRHIRRPAYAAALGSVLLGGCDRGVQAPPKTPPPAVVAHPVAEENLNTITLTAKAAERLGITVEPAAIKNVQRYRLFGGETVLPTGAAIVVSAPLAGTLQPPAKADAPKLGMHVAAKQPVFLLWPLLSPERAVLTPAERIRFAEARNTVAQTQIDAAGQVQQAQVQVDAARIALDRAERLLREQAGTARAVDDAKAQLELNRKSLEAAETRKRLVDAIKLDEDPGKPEPLVIESPREGTLRTMNVAAGEVVAQAAPLFEVIDLDPLWVKAAVYAGEASQIAADEPALVSDLADHEPADTRRKAPPAAAPPSAVAIASAVDLYYELSNADGKLRPGERMTVRLPERGPKESLCVPWSAVVHDVYGGTWVYEQTAPQTFVRRRVEISHVADGQAVLKNGPAAGAAIVASGAMELMGIEFGFAK